MDTDRDMYNNPGQTPISPGTDVYDANGEKVGTVREYNPQASYLVVEKGMLFKKDLYVPVSAINRTTTDGIQLSLFKDDLKADRFTAPPTSDASGMATDRPLDDDVMP
ncbi:MAG TPA: PRC-barrel domain-containing protein [Ktedonobacterales bacterium]|jgi:uncharacterized protein YrrD